LERGVPYGMTGGARREKGEGFRNLGEGVGRGKKKEEAHNDKNRFGGRISQGKGLNKKGKN